VIQVAAAPCPIEIKPLRVMNAFFRLSFYGLTPFQLGAQTFSHLRFELLKLINGSSDPQVSKMTSKQYTNLVGEIGTLRD
jgi:hypothetical protein